MSKARSETNAISMLKEDHQTVKDLFEKFEDAKSDAEKQTIISEAIQELKVHATIEEEIFYPAVRNELEDDILNEAEVEHHVARMLIAELDEEDDSEEYRNARFKVLAEAVKHHIKEEEGQMLPKAKSLDIDFESLGQQMMQRKEELSSEGVPEDAEHEIVAENPGRIRERTTVASGNSGNSRSDGRSDGRSTSAGKSTARKSTSSRKK